MAKPHPEATKRIDAYVAALPDFSREICTRFREIIHRTAPGLVEDWKWGVPCFTGRSLVCGFAAFKKHVTFEFWNGARIEDRHGVLNHGKGNARGRGLKLVEGEPIPEKALVDCIGQAVALDAESTGSAVKKKPARPVVVPEALAKSLALKKNTRAREFFDGLAPSCRREYCEWIASARREETVERRLARTLEQLSRGERMYEKYRK